MTKRDKLIERLKNNPNNVRFEELQTLLLSFGFEERQPSGGSSHYTYTYGTCVQTIPKHKPVNKIYVKMVIKIIEQIQLMEK